MSSVMVLKIRCLTWNQAGTATELIGWSVRIDVEVDQTHATAEHQIINAAVMCAGIEITSLATWGAVNACLWRFVRCSHRILL